MTLNFAAAAGLLLALPGLEAACSKPSKAIARTNLTGHLVTFAAWYPVPVHIGACQWSKYPDTFKRRPNKHRFGVIIGTDDKNFVVEYICLDTGKQPKIETVVYTKREQPTALVIKQIESAHTKVGLDKSKIWYCKSQREK
ncbi:uncharacterized protein LOC117901061 [Drosophila subobscura]|uniref:uncharacterized protein LOC117901061 n=1 Tax=Drosophila subobscura TaxID=7241 RepID=UPI00155A21DC|nr:uncharacterized protein LOC117901061 [Drosophila subobscura]